MESLLKPQNTADTSEPRYTHLSFCVTSGYYIVMAEKDKAAQMLGKKGGQKTKKKYGPAHYKKMGTLSAKKRWGNKPPKDPQAPVAK